jgi:OOP family OmpA-OmpF porin
MKRKLRLFSCSLILLFSFGIALPAQQDEEGSKDHPLLSRMKNFYISSYNFFNYDSYEFYDPEDNEYVIEGQKWVIEYTLKDGFEPPGQLNVMKNYMNAVKKIGGTILNERDVTMKVEQKGNEAWIHLWVSSSGMDYRLTIVEKKTMEQQVVADPEALAGDIESAGHAAIYGIYFDFDSYVIKAQSEPTLNSIAEMLRAHPTFNIYVVGHTDMTGTLDYNMELSMNRADAVVQKLIADYGIDSARIRAKGVGPLCPVSTNQTEEGRKLNRRVELVHKAAAK